jgi:hypothetical protein
MTSTLAPAEPRRRVDGRLVVLLVVIALGARGMLGGALDPVALRTWTTVFVAIVVQALPFLALGVLVSGAITALVSPVVLERALPRSPLLAVPGAPFAVFMLLLVVQPAALGSYAASSRSVVPGGGDFPALAAPVRGAVPMPMAEFVTRAVRDQWLEVEGTWQPRPASPDDPNPQPPVLDADAVHPIAPPRPPMSTRCNSAADGGGHHQ